MTAALVTSRDTETVESYVRLAARWRDEGRSHRWHACPCVVCGDVRRHMGWKPLPIVIGSHVIEALPAEARRERA